MVNAAKDFSLNFAKSLERIFNEQEAKSGKKFSHEYQFGVLPGKTYDKISQTSRSVIRDEQGNIVEEGNLFHGGSVHAFVVRETGDLVKAATWAAPQKSKTHPSGLAVRFNLASPEKALEAIQAADKNGSYLYAN